MTSLLLSHGLFLSLLLLLMLLLLVVLLLVAVVVLLLLVRSFQSPLGGTQAVGAAGKTTEINA